MTTTDNLSNGSTTQERFAGQSRRGRRDAALAAGPTATDLTTGDSAGQSLGSADITSRSPVLPSLDMRGLTEPVFPSGDWSTPQESLAEHPLLRGLHLELPSRAAPPSPEWLDRWFEAARSILELLYVQGASRSR
jgi:hypothetical protein